MSQTAPIPADQQGKPYHQLPDEPDRWYQRFRTFCDLGPSRSLDRCYRVFIAQRDGLPGLPAPGTVRASGSWVEKARGYNWRSRAAAWDDHQRQRKLERRAAVLDDILETTIESHHYLKGVMHGRVVEPDGTVTLITDQYERRMAAKTLFSKGVDLLAFLQHDTEEPRDEIKITEIRVHEPGVKRTPQNIYTAHQRPG